MNPENAVKTAIGFFVIIVAGSLLSSILGGAFGAVVALISPDLVKEMFTHSAAGVVRYAFAVGMLWGLFIGAAASGFVCVLAAIIKILRVRLDVKK